jgi:hypothetical protein
MTVENVDVTPAPAEVVQAEPDYKLQPIPTYVEGSVETRELPAKQGGYTTYMDLGLSGTQILPFEPRRKSATIIATDVAWIGASQQSVMAGGFGAFLMPAGVPITIGHMDEVWAAPVAGTTDVSVMTTFWSE